MTTETCLYRAYNAGGQLLYIGISFRMVGRLMSHKRTAHWFADVTSISIERHPNREAALVAEAAAIATERPIYNISHAVRSPARASPGLPWTKSKIVARINTSNMVSRARLFSRG